MGADPQDNRVLWAFRTSLGGTTPFGTLVENYEAFRCDITRLASGSG
jgi:hypothetical protein